MANSADTCAGLDSTAPQDVLDAIKKHIKADRDNPRQQGQKPSRWEGRQYLDEPDACLVWDLCECDDPYAAVCRGGACALSRTGQKVRTLPNKKPI